MIPANQPKRGGCAFRTAAIGAGAACAFLYAESPVLIRRIRIANATAVAADLALKFMNAAGTPATLIRPNLFEATAGTNRTLQATLNKTFTVPPTVLADIIKQSLLPATIGAAISWEFDEDAAFALDAGTGVVVVNQGALVTGLMDITVEVECALFV